MPAKHLPLAILAALALSACGNREANPADGQADADASAAAASPAAATGTAAKPPALPQPDPAMPLGDYAELKDGQQVMFQYVATSKLPPDFPKLAESFSQEYRRSNDSFRRNDLLQALKPQLEQGIAQAAAAPYIWVELDDAQLQAYDFDRGGFPVGEFTEDRYRYFNNAHEYSYAWANRSQVDFAPVADESIARHIESIRTQWNARPRLRVYSMAQSADMNAQRVNAYVTRVQIVDRNGRVLAEYSPDGSRPADRADAREQQQRGWEDAADAAARAAGGGL